jgi:hypothetical protein
MSLPGVFANYRTQGPLACDLDHFDVYREQLDGAGNTTGWALISSANRGNFIRTNNYDVQQGPVTAKENNIMTANEMRAVRGIDVQPHDVLYITDRTGFSEWQSVEGSDRLRNVLVYETFYCVPTNAPTVIL